MATQEGDGGQQEQQLDQDVEEVEIEDFEEKEPPQKRASVAWDCFKIPSGELKTAAKLVQCTICDKTLSRGTNKKCSCGTTSMLYHLKTYHKKRLQLAIKQREAGGPSPSVAAATIPSQKVPSEVQISTTDMAPEFSSMAMYCMDCSVVISAGEQCLTAIRNAAKQHAC